MENHPNRCSRCRFFDRYYTKETKKFRRTECGWCRKKQELVSTHGECEKYSARTRRCMPQRALYLQLNDLLTEISEIRNFLEDNKLEGEDNKTL